MEVVISYNVPSDIDSWNMLCEENGNFLQSTMYCEVDEMYRHTHIYIEVFQAKLLVGGVKLFLWSSRRAKVLTSRISKQMGQFGEFIISSKSKNENTIIDNLNNKIAEIIKNENAISFTATGYYGNSNLLYNTTKYMQSSSLFDVAYFDLTKSEEELMSNLNSRHRTSLNKAKRSNLTFDETKDINVLIEMLQQTYSVQDKSAPNSIYIKKSWEVGQKFNVSKLYFVRSGDEILSCYEVQIYGSYATLTFGGNKNNNLGAGQFEIWNIMLALKKQGVSNLSFGQVAKDDDHTNMKFSEGITKYKMKFGCTRIPSRKTVFIIKPYKNKLWNIIRKIYGN